MSASEKADGGQSRTVSTDDWHTQMPE